MRPTRHGFGRRRGQTVLGEKVYDEFNEREASGDLPGLCAGLLSEQQETWPVLREGYKSLAQVSVRDLSCNGFSVLLQHNTGRVRSTLAAVSEQDTSKRPCFLCLDHLPEGQKGVLYRSDYLILCNPAPVLPSHLTIAHVDHLPQAISQHVDTLLQLMADLGSGWTILYNGPRCGASAPDHFHLQAVPSGRMPIESELRQHERTELIAQVDGIALHRARDLGREVILLEGDRPTDVRGGFIGFLNALKEILSVDEEPMINVAGSYEAAKWRLLIFPRRKHRPDAFFKKGGARIAVSPAVIEMGGILVTPFARDFVRLDAPMVESIYREVSLEGKSVDAALNAMTRPV